LNAAIKLLRTSRTTFDAIWRAFLLELGRMGLRTEALNISSATNVYSRALSQWRLFVCCSAHFLRSLRLAESRNHRLRSCHLLTHPVTRTWIISVPKLQITCWMGCLAHAA